MRALLVLLALFCSSAFAQFPAVARVVDEAGKLTPTARQELNATLAAEEKATGNQVVVVILNNLRGMTVEDYGNRLLRAWGIGQKGKNNGVVLLVGMAERKVRIEVGYGLESRLTDAKSKRILAERVSPELKKGNFDAGMRAGVAQILQTIHGKD